VPNEFQKIATASGHKVKSMAEALIDAHLQMSGLEYKYEQTLATWDGVPMLPDFVIKYKGETYYWEHVGMLDDAEYVREWQEKKKIYSTGIKGKLLTTNEYTEIGSQINKLLLENFDFKLSPSAK
jgi:predicted nuclease of restriction endonuclease-like RecB superfamily